MMMRVCLLGSVGFILMQSASLLAQQSSTVLGGISLARECYNGAQNATRLRSATRHDIDLCDRAIVDGGLNKSELAASYSNRGIIYMAMEQYVNAYKDYERALDVDASLAEAYINRGNLWFTLQKYEKAISDYDTALEYNTQKQAEALLNRGLARENNGDLGGAKVDYLASLAVNPEWQITQEKLARVNAKLQKTKP